MSTDLPDRTSPSAATFRPDADNRGILFPRLYDLLVSILTWGGEGGYRREILRLAKISAGEHVLDVGCGTGTQALVTHDLVLPDGSVSGVDISPKMIQRARQKAAAAGLDIDFQPADAAALPFADGRFDVVFFTTVLHMIPEAKRTRSLAQAHRVLKPGGRLFLIDYAGALSQRSHWSARHGAHGHFDLKQMREPLLQLGFQEIREAPLRQLSLHMLSGVRT